MTKQKVLIIILVILLILTGFILYPYKSWIASLPSNLIGKLVGYNNKVSLQIQDFKADSKEGTGTDFLQGTWIEAFEENPIGSNQRVYRNEKYYQPEPSWYRHTFIFSDNGSCEILKLDSNDAHYFKTSPCGLSKIKGQEVLSLNTDQYIIKERTENKLILEGMPK